MDDRLDAHRSVSWNSTCEQARYCERHQHPTFCGRADCGSLGQLGPAKFVGPAWRSAGAQVSIKRFHSEGLFGLELVMLLHGILPPVTTPFYPDGNVYFKKLESNVERYSRTPCAGIVVLGSTGEAILLSDQERRDVLKSARGAAAPNKMLIARRCR